MIIDDQHYDVIIVGTGAGGGTLARKLAPSGKRILLLERGDAMPLEEQNISNVDIFQKQRYHAPEQWYDGEGEPFTPQMKYAIGGNTKIYGAALQRMRERDFETVNHQDGISPEWCLKYADLEPYYAEAEAMYQVHGQSGVDPTEPPRSGDFTYPAIAHAPTIQPVVEGIAKRGCHPYPLPISLSLREDDPTGDAEVFGVTPALDFGNVTLKTSAKVMGILTNPSGTAAKAVQAEINGQPYLFLADIIVLACGAINSAVLLLRSANEKHPTGLANGSDQVGRNLMKIQMSSIVEVTAQPNSGKFPRSVGVNDYYWGDGQFSYPMGHIQNMGGVLQDAIFAESPPVLSLITKFMPNFGLKQLATRSIAWWAMTEVLPDPKNRVEVKDGKLYLHFAANNAEAHDRLVYRWLDVLKAVEKDSSLFSRSGMHPRGEVPLPVVANQCGTCVMGTDPDTSVLDINCRAHELDNLYVVDSSFFPSSSSVGPALTVIANALRVGEHLLERLR
ncbi:GMC family oxidoreductase [Leptolyngbya sp. CCNP1308]|uniref:GMC family oxidoreductase n=1 Tax=Leptolyngbya sp. CCNP1308 TaxID=3110255 RepID=UPI002B20722C|nr:GMC family oxidoreductase [Leptolyngbya sp. CCNP1308]MEA5448705.1 GMC family oxidoreductase [Leptolyngbya sp. CCNP1308]